MNRPDFRLTPTQATQILSDTDFFSELDHSVLADLARELKVVPLRGGEVLMSEGEEGDCMYLVLSGRLCASVRSEEGADSEVIVGEISSGESVGEMALITGENRSATVAAVRDSELVKISRAAFERVVRDHPEAVLEISRVIAKRLRKALEETVTEDRWRTIALLPADLDSPATEFARCLVKELRRWGSTLHLNSETLQRLMREGTLDPKLDAKDQSESRILRWLSDQEKQYKFIIYEGDPEPTAWTKRCTRQADRILILTQGDSPHGMDGVENLTFQQDEKAAAAKKELIILHRDVQTNFHRPQEWLERGQIVRHHHVAANCQHDVGRIGRFLAGRALGLVLGGGGARGFAHIGILRALSESRVPVDMIGGVSMGALIGAQYAMGWDSQTMLERNQEELASKNLSREFTLPLVSLTSGRSFDRALDSFFGVTQLEDLKLNFFCVSCNLSTGKSVIHRSGPLRRAVRASNSAPVVLTPTLDQGDLLVDGGILNNQPGDVMKELCGGPTMVVNVSPDRDLSVNESWKAMPSPWKILWSRLNPLIPPIEAPSIPAIMMRTIMVSSQSKSREVENAADFYLRPPVQRFQVDDYAKITEIAEVGYEYASQKIEAWKQGGRLNSEW